MGTHGDDGIADIRWRLETRTVVEKYLQEQGVAHSPVPLIAAQSLPPLMALWHCKPDLWIIAGDLPTDHVTLPRGTSSLVALHAFSLRWKRAAAELGEGNIAVEMALGESQSAEERAAMGEALAHRSRMLLELALQGQDERMEAREAAYAERFGPMVSPVWHSDEDKVPHVDVYSFPPTEERPYWTLVTGGMSELRQPELVVPGDLFPRAELIMYVSEPKPWMMQVLKGLAEMPFDEDAFLYWGHTVPNGMPMTTEPSLLTSFFFEHPYPEGDDGAVFEIDGDPVALLWLRPITEAERAFAIEHGGQALSEHFAKRELGEVVDERRASVV